MERSKRVEAQRFHENSLAEVLAMLDRARMRGAESVIQPLHQFLLLLLLLVILVTVEPVLQPRDDLFDGGGAALDFGPFDLAGFDLERGVAQSANVNMKRRL